MTAPTMGTLAIDNTASGYPGMNNIHIAYGATTAAGTDQSTVTELPNLIGKVKTNIFRPEYGKIIGPYGRAPLGAFFGQHMPFFEGTCASIAVAIRALLAGRLTTEDATSGTPPTVEHKLGLSPGANGPVVKQWQIHFDVWGPQGQIRRIQFHRASFSLTGEDEMDQAANEPLGTGFRIDAFHDEGARAGGLDPIGYAYDLAQLT